MVEAKWQFQRGRKRKQHANTRIKFFPVSMQYALMSGPAADHSSVVEWLVEQFLQPLSMTEDVDET